jgi:plastocyanin
MLQTLGRIAVGIAMLCGTSFSVGAQDARVTAQVQIVAKSAAKPATTHAATSSSSDVVVWLEPIDPDGKPIASAIDPPRDVQLVQRNKTFEPHVVVVPVGTVVQFPNKDPFFHNVFSLFDGKRFDLGLYEAGSTKPLRFDRPGVSFLFCNIHPEMSAVVVVVQTPYFAKSDRSGRISIAGVPDGRYRLRVWYERSAPEDLRKLDRAVVISPDSRALGEFRVPEDPNATLAHKNKYGQDYPPPANGIYH